MANSYGRDWSPVVDGWSFKYLVRGMVAYHEAKSCGIGDPEHAFWVKGTLRFKKDIVPRAFLEYPDLCSAALAVVELDDQYRYSLVDAYMKSIGETPWSAERVEQWREERKAAADRYNLLLMMIDAEDTGLVIPSPEAETA